MRKIRKYSTEVAEKVLEDYLTAKMIEKTESKRNVIETGMKSPFSVQTKAGFTHN